MTTPEVSIEQAAKNALAVYLAAQIPTATFLDRWPEAGQDVANRTISVIFAADSDEEYWQPTLQSSTPNVGSNPPTVTAIYEIASVTQPLQLDVWCTSETDRDDLVKKLADALSLGVGVTLAQGATGGDPVRNGILLPLADGWSGNVDITFDRARRVNTSDSETRSEYRAMALGAARMVRTETRTLPEMKAIHLKQKTYETTTVPTGNFDITTVTDTGVTHTKGP